MLELNQLTFTYCKSGVDRSLRCAISRSYSPERGGDEDIDLVLFGQQRWPLQYGGTSQVPLDRFDAGESVYSNCTAFDRKARVDIRKVRR